MRTWVSQSPEPRAGGQLVQNERFHAFDARGQLRDFAEKRAGWLLLAIVGALIGYAIAGSMWDSLVAALLVPVTVIFLLNQAPIVSIICWIALTPVLHFYMRIELPPGIPDITPGRALALIVLFVAIVRSLPRFVSRVGHFPQHINWALYVFVVLRTMSTIWSPVTMSDALIRVVDGVWIPFLLYRLTVAAIQRREDVDRLLRALLLLALVAGGLGMIEGLLQLDRGIFAYLGAPRSEHQVWTLDGVRRAAGPFINPASFGLHLGLGMLIALRRVRGGNGIRGAHMAFAFCLCCVFACFTRGAWLGVAVGQAVFLILTADWKLFRPFLLLTVGLSLIVTVTTIGSHERFAERLGNEGTANTRLALADRGLQMIGRKPWLGAGIGGYHDGHWRFDSTFGAPDRMSSHNTYLTVAIDSGLPALLLLLLALWRPVARAVSWARLQPKGSVDRSRIALLVGGVAILAAGGSSYDLNTAVYDLTVLFVLLACIERSLPRPEAIGQ